MQLISSIEAIELPLMSSFLRCGNLMWLICIRSSATSLLSTWVPNYVWKEHCQSTIMSDRAWRTPASDLSICCFLSLALCTDWYVIVLVVTKLFESVCGDWDCFGEDQGEGFLAGQNHLAERTFGVRLEYHWEYSIIMKILFLLNLECNLADVTTKAQGQLQF